MESEHYKLGFEDATEGRPRRRFSMLLWQEMYNMGYNDALRGLLMYDTKFGTMIRQATRRGGC
jgi:hypothetical protein